MLNTSALLTCIVAFVIIAWVFFLSWFLVLSYREPVIKTCPICKNRFETYKTSEPLCDVCENKLYSEELLEYGDMDES